MKISYYCEYCGEHRRKGDHSECRKALKATRKKKPSREVAPDTKHKKRILDY